MPSICDKDAGNVGSAFASSQFASTAEWEIMSQTTGVSIDTVPLVVPEPTVLSLLALAGTLAALGARSRG